MCPTISQDAELYIKAQTREMSESAFVYVLFIHQTTPA